MTPSPKRKLSRPAPARKSVSAATSLFAVSLLLTMLCTAGAAAADLRFAVAVQPAPVLNTPDFRSVFGGIDGKTLLTDRCGQIRALEFVALPGTLFTVEERIESASGVVFRVRSDDYPYPSAKGYYVDGRAVVLESARPPERARQLPAKESILAALKKRVGTRYVWGGNTAPGVAELTAWYPPAGTVDRALWQLAGLDCSGLLYEATGGYTPRNTGSLVLYGSPVQVAGKSAAAIAASLRPLDLIVWPGHVLIVLDDGKAIESRLVCGRPEEGVRIRPLTAVLTDIMETRKPADRLATGAREFVVRRWFGDKAVTAP
jgi:cell wall-associated NlpC family hydrolase